MRLHGWLERYRLILLLLLAGLLLLAAAGSAVETRIAYVLSTSPENSFVTGSSSFYTALVKQGYHATLASPRTLKDLAERLDCTVYMLIGPDKPLEPSEAELIANLYREGKISILVADETGAANILLTKLHAATIGSLVLAPAKLTGSSLITPIYCGSTVTVSSKVVALTNIDGGRVVCTAYNGREWIPIAALYTNSKGAKLLVIGDSSIFANFEFDGLYGFPKTDRLALKLVSLIAKPGCTIVYDNSHYLTARIRFGRLALFTSRLLLAAPQATALAILSQKPLAALALAFTAALTTALYLLGAPWTPKPLHSEVEEYEKNTQELIEELEAMLAGQDKSTVKPTRKD